MPEALDGQDSILSEVNSMLEHEDSNELAGRLEKEESKDADHNINEKNSKSQKLKKVFWRFSSF